MRVRIRPFDIVSIALSIALVVAFSAAVYAGNGGKAQAAVSAPGGEWIYPLDKDIDLSFDGPLGKTEVEIRDGGARVLHSPCPNQTCVASGSISRPGQWIACLPNKIFVRIEGSGQEEGVDAAVF
jgi:hypothetical protein